MARISLHGGGALGEVADGHGHRGTVGGERPGGLDAEAGRRAGDEDPLAGEVDPLEDVVGGALEPEAAHGAMLAGSARGGRPPRGAAGTPAPSDRPGAGGRSRGRSHGLPARDRTRGPSLAARPSSPTMSSQRNESSWCAVAGLGGVHADLGGRELHDEPAPAGVDVPEPEQVPQDRPHLLGLRRVEERVRTDDRHAAMLARHCSGRGRPARMSARGRRLRRPAGGQRALRGGGARGGRLGRGPQGARHRDVHRLADRSARRVRPASRVTPRSSATPALGSPTTSSGASPSRRRPSG